jgi:hypothetical protein
MFFLILSSTIFVGLAKVARRGYGDVQDGRCVRRDFLDDGRIGVLREFREDAVHLVPDLLRADLGILVEHELYGDDRDTFRRRRAQIVDTGDGVDGFFDALRNLRLYFFRSGAAERRW